MKKILLKHISGESFFSSVFSSETFLSRLFFLSVLNNNSGEKKNICGGKFSSKIHLDEREFTVKILVRKNFG